MIIELNTKYFFNSENVIVINNGTFKNESNHSSNHKLNKNDDKIDKIKSLKVINRANDLEDPEKYNRTGVSHTPSK